MPVERGERTVITLLTEMLMLPFTAFLHGMELLVRAVQGTQSATERGIHAIAEVPRTSAAAAERDRNQRSAGNSGRRATSGNDGGPEPRPALNEADAMDTSIGYESRRDRDLRDDTLKLVRYKILFVKREYEVAFREQEDLVYDNMDATSFAAWKVAEFVQRLHETGEEVPLRWRNRYPNEPEDRSRYIQGGLVRGLPEDDKKYLRVYYEVLDRYPREKFRHDEQHINALVDIRDEIRGLRTGAAGSSSGGGGATPAGGGSGDGSAPSGGGGGGTGGGTWVTS
jgi:hypothetical protein